jgi:hypothetical protein
MATHLDKTRSDWLSPDQLSALPGDYAEPLLGLEAVSSASVARAWKPSFCLLVANAHLMRFDVLAATPWLERGVEARGKIKSLSAHLARFIRNLDNLSLVCYKKSLSEVRSDPVRLPALLARYCQIIAAFVMNPRLADHFSKGLQWRSGSPGVDARTLILRSDHALRYVLDRYGELFACDNCRCSRLVTRLAQNLLFYADVLWTIDHGTTLCDEVPHRIDHSFYYHVARRDYQSLEPDDLVVGNEEKSYIDYVLRALAPSVGSSTHKLRVGWLMQLAIAETLWKVSPYWTGVSMVKHFSSPLNYSWTVWLLLFGYPFQRIHTMLNTAESSVTSRDHTDSQTVEPHGAEDASSGDCDEAGSAEDSDDSDNEQLPPPPPKKRSRC